MQTYIADTANITFRRKRDQHVVFTAEAQLAGLNGEEESEVIRGGIGNKSLYTIKHSKEVTLSVRNAVFNLEFLAMSQGVEIEDDKAIVTRSDNSLEVVDGEITLTQEPKGDVLVRYSDGSSKSVTATDKTVEVDGENGDKVTAVYQAEVKGRKITLDATEFAENYEVEYATIEYNTQTNKIVRDIYFVFNNATPAGSYEINFENGEAYTPELEFTAMTETNSDEIGFVIEVDREDVDTP